MHVRQISAESLRVVPALGELPDSELARILEISEARSYADGETVFREGQTANALYFVLEGRIRIYRQGSGGLEAELALLEHGSIMGEVALLTRSGRNASATARGEVCLLRTPSEPLLEDYRAGRLYSLKLLMGVARLLAHRLEDMNRRVMGLLLEQRPKGQEFEDFKRKILDDWAV